ncbi:MAG: ABC transporter ATP-binding protein [Candidatus Nezhaarchaeales archaeon]
MERVTVETVDLWKIYVVGRIEYPALKGVNLKVGQGRFVAIVGPSGSGKTTLLNLIGALDKPTKGEVFIDGEPISKLNGNQLAELRNRKIGFVFQAFNLIPYLSALQNVELPMIAAGVPPKRRRDKALKLLELVGLKDKALKKPLELSAGEQQRVAMARALSNSPTIILADEPTGNLDSKTGFAIVKALKELCTSSGVTTIMVTHNMEATKLCDAVIHLKDGVIEREVVQR